MCVPEVSRMERNGRARVRKKAEDTDNGGEHTSNEFQAYLRDNVIKHETTIPKTPEQNGVAERKNRTLIEPTRTMLFEPTKTILGRSTLYSRI